MTTERTEYPYNCRINAEYLEENIYPSDMPALVIEHNTPGETVRAHWHRGLEIVLVERGSVTWRIDERTVRMDSGGLLLISPYSVHQVEEPLQADSGRCRTISITFNNDIVEKAFPYADRSLFSINAPNADEHARRRLRELVEETARWHAKEGRMKTLKVNALLYETLHLTYDRFTTGVRKPELIRGGQHLVMQIIGHLEDHYGEPITATQTAALFGYSREHFSRMFKTATGMSFKRFLTRMRLQEATRRLESSTAPVATIAAACGFADSRAMDVAFRREYGMGAREYRKTTALADGGAGTWDAATAGRRPPAAPIDERTAPRRA